MNGECHSGSATNLRVNVGECADERHQRACIREARERFHRREPHGVGIVGQSADQRFDGSHLADHSKRLRGVVPDASVGILQQENERRHTSRIRDDAQTFHGGLAHGRIPVVDALEEMFDGGRADRHCGREVLLTDRKKRLLLRIPGSPSNGAKRLGRGFSNTIIVVRQRRHESRYRGPPDSNEGFGCRLSHRSLTKRGDERRNRRGARICQRPLRHFKGVRERVLELLHERLDGARIANAPERLHGGIADLRVAILKSTDEGLDRCRIANEPERFRRGLSQCRVLVLERQGERFNCVNVADLS